MSEGADSIFAEAALSLGIKLESIIPFKNFQSDFDGDFAYERYRHFRRSATNAIRTNFGKRCKLAYRKSMEWVIYSSNIILAIWDGREIGATGGTWEAVSLCKKLQKPLIHINPGNCKISFHYFTKDEYRLKKNIKIKQIIGTF
jgi:hypothetical protein